MRTRFLFGLLSLLATAAGCAQVPKPMPYSWTPQYHMQAAHHWSLLANDVAASPGLQGQTIYLSSDDRVPFDHAYRSFLTTALTNQSIKVVPAREAASATLRWSVQPVIHYGPRSAPGFPLGWAGTVATFAVASPFAEVTPAYTGTLPRSEIIITTSAIDRGNTLVLHRSDVYYVHEADLRAYLPPLPAAPPPQAVHKTYAVVDK